MKFRFIKILVLLSAAQCSFAQPNDSLIIKYNYINSIPQNADVYINGTFGGKTPFRFIREDADSNVMLEIKVMLKGYKVQYFRTDTLKEPVNKTFVLEPLPGLVTSDSKNLVIKDKPTYFKSPRKVVPIVLCSVVTLGSFVTSFYFKTLANENYDWYYTYGDTEALDRSRKYDLISAITLTTFQAGIAGLIYFLFID